MEENDKIWTGIFFFSSSYDVLGNSTSKLPGINLNIRICALSLNILIYFFSFPSWLAQLQWRHLVASYSV